MKLESNVKIGFYDSVYFKLELNVQVGFCNSQYFKFELNVQAVFFVAIVNISSLN